MVVADFGEAAVDREVFGLACAGVAESAFAELGEKRGVAGQDPKIPVFAGDFGPFGRLIYNLPLGCCDFDLKVSAMGR